METRDPGMIKLGSELRLIRGMHLAAKLEEISALCFLVYSCFQFFHMDFLN